MKLMGLPFGANPHGETTKESDLSVFAFPSVFGTWNVCGPDEKQSGIHRKEREEIESERKILRA